MTDTVRISLTVNDEKVSSVVEPRMSLIDMLRHELHLTGSHVGCEMGACGACLLLLDGTVVHGCLTLAVEADGREIVTIEGLSDSGKISDLQTAFHQRNAVQCGFCTPGMLMIAQELLAQEENPSRAKIRDALSGNFCRCTGYEAIIDAIEEAAKHRRETRTSST